MYAGRKIALGFATVALAGALATVTGPARATSATGTSATGTSATGTSAATECGVRADGKLWCGNRVGAKGYEHRRYNSAVRGPLNTSPSWFQCWGRGDQHAGGNNVWYWTQLDNGQWGNVAAVDLHTSVDPAPGLREC